ncbi:MAG: hypothetical protein PHV11_08680 [Candidatus Bipolaricaulis sp.]|nr:hypothetical protein [Candidatus Bipolaricaulis sp.]
MLLTRDLTVDWNNVPDVGSGLPAGFIQFRIKDYEEKMSKDKPGETDKAGNPVVAKYMLVMHLEAVAPEEAVGATKTEYFVLGSNTDPMMQQTQTFYDSIGARSWKKYLADAQVPWSQGIVATANSSIGAMFISQVKHKLEKNYQGEIDEATGKVREYVGSNLGKTYKIGEMVPRLVPCGIKECGICANAEAGEQAPAAAPTMTVPAPGPAPTVAAAPKPMSAPPLPGGMPTAPKPPLAVVKPTEPVAPVSAPAAGMVVCKICGASVPEADYPAHVAECAAKVAGQFKQEA